MASQHLRDDGDVDERREEMSEKVEDLWTLSNGKQLDVSAGSRTKKKQWLVGAPTQKTRGQQAPQ